MVLLPIEPTYACNYCGHEMKKDNEGKSFPAIEVKGKDDDIGVCRLKDDNEFHLCNHCIQKFKKAFAGISFKKTND